MSYVGDEFNELDYRQRWETLTKWQDGFRQPLPQSTHLPHDRLNYRS
jgi:hypothetical protein